MQNIRLEAEYILLTRQSQARTVLILRGIAGEGWIYSEIYRMTIKPEDHKFIYTFKEMQKRNLKMVIVIIPQKEIKLFENVKVEPKKPEIKIN